MGFRIPLYVLFLLDERNESDDAKKEDSRQQMESLPIKRDSLAKRKESESHHKKKKKKKVKQD